MGYKTPNPEHDFKPGQSGNPNGRPKGALSIKNRIRKYLNEHPDEIEKVVQHFVKKNPELMWQMLEGKPQQDVTSGGEKLPTPILAGYAIPSDDSLEENPGTETAP